MAERDPECVFCRIEAGEIPSLRVEEDERTIAFLDVSPAVPGHTIVVPRAHTTDLTTIPAEDLAACAETARRVAGRLTERLDASGVNLLNNCGPEAWQTVFHFHLHVIPRRAGDPLVLPWTPTPGNQDEIRRTHARLVA